MVFFIDEAGSRPPPRLLTNVNKKMVFFIEGFPYRAFTPLQADDTSCPFSHDWAELAGCWIHVTRARDKRQ